MAQPILLRHRVSGALLALNVGSASKIYGEPPEPPPSRPVFVTSPSFLTPVPNTVGSVLNMSYGTVSPSDSFTEIRIGYLVGGVMTGPFIQPGGTIPAEWLGKTPVAECTAIRGDLSSEKLLVSSGVTVQPGADGDGFPAYATYELFGTPDGSGHWFAREKRTGSISGKRIFSVVASAPMPTGFTLRWCSGGTLGGIANDTNTREIWPGETLETNGQMPIGTTCYNDLFWRRISDGAYKRAHQAVSPIRFTILGLVTPPPDPGGLVPDLTPDVTFSSFTAARSRANEYIAAWTGTIPSEKNADSDRVIKVSGSTSGLMDLSGLRNPHASATARRIIFRLDGTYSDSGLGTSRTTQCSNRHNGGVNFANSRGIHLALTHVRTGGGSNFTADDSELCGAMYCLIEGQAPNFSIPPPNWIGPYPRRTNGFALQHCLIRSYGEACIAMSNTRGSRIWGNLTDLAKEDEWVVYWGVDSMRFERNWGCRLRVYGDGDPHEDFYQNQGGFETNCTFDGVVFLNANRSESGAAKGAYQGLFHKYEAFKADPYPLDFTGTTFKNVIGYLNNGSIKGAASAQGAALDFCTFVTAGDPGSNGHGALIDGLAPRRRNYMAAGTAAHAARVGTDGLHRPIGTMGARNYSALANDFRYGIPWQNSSGVVIPYADQTLKAFEPKVGEQLYWVHATPVGAYLRSREIFDASYRATAGATAGYKVMPHKWPVLGIWHERYNNDSYVDDGYTGGAYTSNGDPA